MMPLGLTEEDLKKPTTTEVEAVRVSDGKGSFTEVRVGDKVELLDSQNDKYHLDYLGPGPYTIEWLAKWRCGMGFLQLTTPTKGKGKGMNDCYLKIAS